MYGTKEVYGGGGGCDVCIVFLLLVERERSERLRLTTLYVLVESECNERLRLTTLYSLYSLYSLNSLYVLGRFLERPFC